MSEHSINYDIHTHIDRDTDIITLAEGWRDAAKDQSRSIINLKEDAIRDALIDMGWTPPPKWRKEPPDAPGWYWWRSEKFPTPDIVWIYKYGPGLKVNDPSERLSSQQLSPEESGGEWSGPILPPEGGAE